jgi:hypothetical protein
VVWDNPIKHWNKDELKAHIKTEITRRIKEWNLHTTTKHMN